MADDLGLGIGFLQVFEQEPEGGLLLGSASIGITTSIIHATNVADANGVLVVVLDMGTSILLRTSWMNASVLINDPVVATAGLALVGVCCFVNFLYHLTLFTHHSTTIQPSFNHHSRCTSRPSSQNALTFVKLLLA